MWKTKTVSVIFPTYNETDSIGAAIEEFFADGWVDEIVVVDNNAAPGTVEEVLKTNARIVHEPRSSCRVYCVLTVACSCHAARAQVQRLDRRSQN